MNKDFEITKQVADAIVKVCFDTVEFSRLYDQDIPNNAKRIFQCNDDVKKGLKWFISSENTKDMHDNIGTYIASVKFTLEVYNHLNLSFENKEKLISTLNSLHSHLIELQKQINHTQE